MSLNLPTQKWLARLAFCATGAMLAAWALQFMTPSTQNEVLLMITWCESAILVMVAGGYSIWSRLV